MRSSNCRIGTLEVSGGSSAVTRSSAEMHLATRYGPEKPDTCALKGSRRLEAWRQAITDEPAPQRNVDFRIRIRPSKSNAELRVGWKVLKRLPIVRPKGSFRKLRGSSPLLSPAWMCANNQGVNLCRMKVRRNVKTKDAGNTAFFVCFGRHSDKIF